MSFEWRGGIPRNKRVTVDTTGRAFVMIGDPGQRLTTKWLRIGNVGANELRIFWTEADFTAGTNYLTLVATSGFIEGPIEPQASTLWAKADGGNTTMEMMMIHRRG